MRGRGRLEMSEHELNHHLVLEAQDGRYALGDPDTKCNWRRMTHEKQMETRGVGASRWLP